MSKATRWILVVPAALATWFAIFFFLGDYYSGLTSQCDSAPALPECQTAWYLTQKAYLPAFGAAISAIVVVLVVYLVAPSNKLRAAWVSCAVGSALAAAMSVADQAAAVSAISAGLATVCVLTWLARKPTLGDTGSMSPNTSLERTRDR
jgi:hypothetical protein